MFFSLEYEFRKNNSQDQKNHGVEEDRETPPMNSGGQQRKERRAEQDRVDLNDAFCKAVERCGEILATHFPRQADDRDELPNKLIND